eukprot:scaffold91681_cov30-Phaeocystis_antarctica.AAC.2
MLGVVPFDRRKIKAEEEEKKRSRNTLPTYHPLQAAARQHVTYLSPLQAAAGQHVTYLPPLQAAAGQHGAAQAP